MSNKYTKRIHVHAESVVLWVELVLLFVAFVAYGYFIVSSVAHVVIKREMLISKQETESKISKLEAEYFEKTKNISEDIASDYGLVAVAPSAYITISDGNEKLSRNDR